LSDILHQLTDTGSWREEARWLGWTREHRWSRRLETRGLGQARAHSRSWCQETRWLGWWNGWRVGAANDRQSRIQGRDYHTAVFISARASI